MDNCIFCKIIDKSEPVSIIFENERVMALMSLFPFSEGHCLVIPKQHFASFKQLDEEVGQEWSPPTNG